jgi:putative transposase
MIYLARLLLRLLADLVQFAALAFKTRQAIVAENLILRRQIALFQQRGIQPYRIDAATRLSLAIRSRLCNWRSGLTVVRPQTVLRWHRAGCRLFWWLKSRPGHPMAGVRLIQFCGPQGQQGSYDWPTGAV